MAEYSRMASGQVVSNGAATPVILPFIPNKIEIFNRTRAVAGAGITKALWMTDMGQGAAFATLFGTGDVYIDVVGGTSTGGQTNGTGFSTFSAGIALQFGPINQHGGSPVSDFSIATGSPTTITTVGNHGLVSGDVVIFSNLFQTAATGMQQIAGIPFVITRTGATTFTIPFDTTGGNFTAFNTATSTGNVGSFKQLLYPALYAPNLSYVTGITLGATTVIALSMPGNFVVGQEVAFRIPSVWGTVELNTLPNILIPGSPVYGFVTAVSASLTTPTITVNINSVGFTAFNPNQSFASFSGEKWPQVISVGDANSGSNQLNFLSPQVWMGNSATLARSINGPAIAGAFINNTNQGFIIGSGVSGTAADVIYWDAYLHDINT